MTRIEKYEIIETEKSKIGFYDESKSKRKKPITFKRKSKSTHAPKVSGVRGPGKGWWKQSQRHRIASIKGWKGRR